jgi:AcrR family transcriptional regulator
MVQTPSRSSKARETRQRIADAALDLFTSQGYAQTTIDEIAAAAGVNRRTVFRHFATKEAMVFDHLAVGRDFIIRSLTERPAQEPVLVSLHAVLRELCVRGYERRLLAQIRAVTTLEPRFAAEQFSIGFQAFEKSLIAVVVKRADNRHSPGEIQGLTEMAEGWFLSAVRMFFRHGERTLVEYFDEVVAACVQSSAHDLRPALAPPAHLHASRQSRDQASNTRRYQKRR